MALLTVEEVQDEAILRDTDLTAYSDEMIERKISQAQAYIETYTGQHFNTTVISGEQHLQNKGNSIILDQTPIVSVEQILIDGDIYSLDDITINYNTGIVYLNTPTSPITGYPFNLNQPYDAVVDYTTGESPTTNQSLIISEICMDLFFINIDKGTEGKDIKSFKDSDFSVTYEQDDPMDNINKRLAMFRKVTLEMI